ncbi:hypothetical protein GXM_01269 [Nostoc sphaeroides CCNUC1]|uniref:Uncharacterized protein n=1 Tax=Nostoc sphaeroides CCNUC1 TaxID=2653204 RepID=A0A5P8VUH6_9NOSO|nr:hypothetical protein GXM_01269 [Nostoc sphaeroides CCNUC1]
MQASVSVTTRDIRQLNNYILQANQITKDLLLWRVPENLKTLMRVKINFLVG